jgi:prepilin-type N-terminal cleavage/methylation domain-containing protein
MVSMQRRTHGFTIIELLIVIMIGSVLVGVTFSGVQGVQTRMAVQGAKTAYMTVFQRSRAKSIEMGETIIIQSLSSTDVVRTWERSGNSIAITSTVNFRDEFDVDLQGSSFYMCMTPRGYADRDCGGLRELAGYTGISTAQQVQFWLGTDSTSVLVLPLGQLIR